MAGLGHQLAHHGAGTLRLHQVQRAGAQTGEQGDGQDEHAHTAQPVHEGTPEQDALWQGLHGGENRGAGGSEAGDRLKETVDVGAEQAKLRIEPSPEKKRQRAQGPHQKPDQGNGEEALPGKEVVVAAQMGQDQPYGRDERDGDQKGKRIFAIKQAYQQRQQHGGGLHQQGLAGQFKDQSEVHCTAPISSSESS